MHIYEYVKRKYLAGNGIPESVLLFKQCAERYFGKENVMLDVGGQSADSQTFESCLESDIIRQCRSLWLEAKNRSYRNAYHLVRTINELSHQYCKFAVIIHIPYKKITNENDLSTDLYDVFLKLQFSNSGRFFPRFQILRSTYTLEQFNKGYMHSHTPAFNLDFGISWETPCTGSGPINGTMMELSRQSYFLDENTIQLLLWELDKFVGVESIAGGPYMRIENMGNNQSGISRVSSISRYISDPHMKEFFISYLQSKRMKIAFKNGCYVLADSFDNWWLDISDYYIYWCNANIKNHVINSYLLAKYIKSGNTISHSNQITLSSRQNTFIEENNGVLTIIKFNGVEYKFKIHEQESTAIEVRLLAYDFAYALLFKILQIINYYHGKFTKEYRKTFASTLIQETRTHILTGKTIF